jgi:membrane protein
MSRSRPLCSPAKTPWARITTLWRVTLRAAQDWWEDNCLRLASSLAYYTALSLAPLVLLIVGLTGMLVGREQVASQLAARLESLMGPAGRELVNSILSTTSPQGRPWATVVGLLTLVLGAQPCLASSRRR